MDPLDPLAPRATRVPQATQDLLEIRDLRAGLDLQGIRDLQVLRDLLEIRDPQARLDLLETQVPLALRVLQVLRVGQGPLDLQAIHLLSQDPRAGQEIQDMAQRDLKAMMDRKVLKAFKVQLETQDHRAFKGTKVFLDLRDPQDQRQSPP